MRMRQLIQIGLSIIAVSLSAVSFAGATTINVSGTNNPSAYIVYFGTDPGGPTGSQAIAVTKPAGPWASGYWITLNNPDQSWPMDSTSGSLPGTYYYFTKFDLTGLNPATAVIKGNWASDNGSALYLNGISPANLVGQISGDNDTGFQSPTNFAITGGFLTGTNYLEFVVTNDPWNGGGNPTGLLVNIDQATAAPVPEPSTIFLLCGGLLGTCLYRRRAKK